MVSRCGKMDLLTFLLEIVEKSFRRFFKLASEKSQWMEIQCPKLQYVHVGLSFSS
jgi:hypothetical protein